jgi:hypothetical protein
MSRKEKWMMKKVQKMRDQETHENPLVPYRRVTIKTKMYWPLELMRQGKTKIIFQYIAIWALILLGIGIALFFLVRWLLSSLGWWSL